MKNNIHKAYTKTKQQTAKTKLLKLGKRRSKMSGRCIRGVMITVASRDKMLKMLLRVAAARRRPKAFNGVNNVLQLSHKSGTIGA